MGCKVEVSLALETNVVVAEVVGRVVLESVVGYEPVSLSDLPRTAYKWKSQTSR